MAFDLAPHRNLIAVGVVAVAVIASTIIVIHNTQENTNAAAGTIENATTSQNLIQVGGGIEDVDASGTPEWQRALLAGIYGTSTGGLNTNVTLAGSSSVPTTLTDALAQDLLSQFSAMQASGEVTAQNEQDIVSNLLSNYDPENAEPVFGLSDIIVSQDTSLQAIKKYANTFALIEQTRIGLMVASLTKNPDAQEISATYVQIAADLKQVPVPVPLEQLDLSAVNNYEKIATSLADVVNYENDPTKGLFALKEYQDAMTERGAIYTELANYLQENGILFGENEPGYAWNAFESTTSQ